jgi:hypothetical protein
MHVHSLHATHCAVWLHVAYLDHHHPVNRQFFCRPRPSYLSAYSECPNGVVVSFIQLHRLLYVYSRHIVSTNRAKAVGSGTNMLWARQIIVDIHL